MLDAHEMGGQDTFMTPLESQLIRILLISLNGEMYLPKIKLKHLIKKIGGFIQVNGTKIFIQDIHFMFNLEKSLNGFFMSNFDG